MNRRKISQRIAAVVTTDGAGVKLKRSLGQHPGARLDPFLMLDEFYSEHPEDYLAGFPAHPHRGFETVTYMLAGHMRHEDHLGNCGEIGPGGVQWMTAGNGIIHSEMPMQESGLLRGFQLWINLPAAEKRGPATYRELSASQIPVITPTEGLSLRHIAGQCSLPDYRLNSCGYINGIDGQSFASDPLYIDVQLAATQSLTVGLNPAHTAFVYAYEGQITIENSSLDSGQLGVLSEGDRVNVQSKGGSRFLLIAGQPFNEPIVQYGPFVMNSKAEIEQALQDYRDGRLTHLPEE